MSITKSPTLLQPDLKLWREYTEELRVGNESRRDKWQSENQKLKQLEEEQEVTFDALPWHRKIWRNNPRNCTSVARIVLNEVMWYPAHSPKEATLEGYWTWLATKEASVKD